MSFKVKKEHGWIVEDALTKCSIFDKYADEILYPKNVGEFWEYSIDPSVASEALKKYSGIVNSKAEKYNEEYLRLKNVEATCHILSLEVLF